jgi:opacity protein-like surface antigen
MKKFLLLAIVALLVSVPVFAADFTAQVSLQVGAVYTINSSISTSPISLATGAGPFNQSLGTVTISSNQSSTFTYLVQSLNPAPYKGMLKGAATNATHDYTVTFAGTTTPTALTSDLSSTIAVAANVASVPELKIQYGSTTGLVADTYSDSIKVTVAIQ